MLDPMADPERFEKACAGKEKHPSEAAAQAAINLLRHEGKLRHTHSLEVYECRFCGHFHFGN